MSKKANVRKIMFVLALFALAISSTTVQAQQDQETMRLIESFKAKCSTFGFTEGTDGHANCVRSEANSFVAGRQAQAQRQRDLAECQNNANQSPEPYNAAAAKSFQPGVGHSGEAIAAANEARDRLIRRCLAMRGYRVP